LTPLPGDLVATQIFDHALAGDSLAQTILDRCAQTLAHAIYNVSLVINCPLFVLGGSIGVHPALWKTTRELLPQGDRRVHLKLVRSTLGQDAQVIGAICLALETAGSRVQSS
jgi:glucokinase